MKTIRTEQSGFDYFESKWSNYIANKNCYGYLGHTHINIKYSNFETIGSAGYDGYFKYIETSEGRTLLIADMHLGLLETEENFVNKILPELNKEDYNLVIFLGDNFEMALCSDEEIKTSNFFEWLKNTRKEVCMLIGNHSYNLDKKEGLRLYLLSQNHNIYLARELIIGSLYFAHGDEFDPYVMRFGKLYHIVFSVIDYSGKYGRVIWNKVKKYFGV